MQAEIAKMAFISQDAVYTATAQVPRRTYLDFFPELYPPMDAYLAPAQHASQWLKGDDALSVLVTPQPGKSWGAQSQQSGGAPADAAKSAVSPPAAKTGTPASTPTAAPQAAPSNAAQDATKPTSHTSSTTAAVESVKSVVETSANTVVAAAQNAISTVSSTVQQAVPAVVEKLPSAQTSTPIKQPNVPDPVSKTQATPKTHDHWSRTFLAGKTPLKPDYDDVHGVATTLSASVQLLQANAEYIFYPLAGPGGRLAVVRVADKGRLPTHSPSLACGSTIVDYALDPFKTNRVYIAGSDGNIYVMDVPEKLEGDHGSPVAVLSDHMDKITGITSNPVASDILLCASEDGGEGVLRVFDVSKSAVVAPVTVPGKGVSIT